MFNKEIIVHLLVLIITIIYIYEAPLNVVFSVVSLFLSFRSKYSSQYFGLMHSQPVFFV
jgi:hypothetical protein